MGGAWKDVLAEAEHLHCKLRRDNWSNQTLFVFTLMLPCPRLISSASVGDLLLQRISRLLATGGGMVTRLCEGRFGITRREWRVMAVLVKEQGILPSQLADPAQLDRARTSRAITALACKQLVACQPKPGNRRAAILTLTAQGQSLYDALVLLAVDINRHLMAGLSVQDMGRLDAMLDNLQTCAEGLVARADLPKADRRRGARKRWTTAPGLG